MISIDLFPLFASGYVDVSLTGSRKIVCFCLCTYIVHGRENNCERQYHFIVSADMCCFCNKLPRQKKCCIHKQQHLILQCQQVAHLDKQNLTFESIKLESRLFYQTLTFAFLCVVSKQNRVVCTEPTLCVTYLNV